MIEHDQNILSAAKSKDNDFQDPTQTKHLSSLPVSSMKRNGVERTLSKPDVKDSIVESRTSDFKAIFKQN